MVAAMVAGKNVGQRRGWEITVHGDEGAPGGLHNNQMIGRGLMSLGRQTNRIMGRMVGCI